MLQTNKTTALTLMGGLILQLFVNWFTFSKIAALIVLEGRIRFEVDKITYVRGYFTAVLCNFLQLMFWNVL